MADFSADAPEVMNAHLDENPYLGGDLPSDVDAKVYNQFKNKVPDRIVYPHLWAWYVFLSQYTPAARNGWKAAAPAKKADAPKKEEAKKEEAKAEEPAAAEEEDDDDFDFFSGDAGAEEEAIRIKEKMEEEKKELMKRGPVCKSYVVFEVKPADDSVDLDELAEKIIATVTMEGLHWKTEFKKEPVAYGIFKLIIAATIVDDLVSTDIMIEQIEEIKGMIMPESDEEGEDEEENAEKPPKEKIEGNSVQSVEILAFNKL